jgi:hypothetical protein
MSLCRQESEEYTHTKLNLINLIKQKNNLLVEENVSDTVLASLKIDKHNNILYFLNNKIIWTSNNPRTYVDCIESKILKSSILYVNDLNSWSYVHESHDKNVRLHLKPLAITYEKENKRKLLWTFFSGWDSSSLCAMENCKIPLPLKQSNSLEINHGSTVLQNELLFLALLNNGDLAIVKKNKVDNSYAILKSLMQQYCDPNKVIL